jgi:hypothetical protein
LSRQLRSRGFRSPHVRWLEALRGAGYARPIDADPWRVPIDLSTRRLAHNLARDHTNPCLYGQIGRDAATWLDRELVSRDRMTLANIRFGRAVIEARISQAEPW